MRIELIGLFTALSAATSAVPLRGTEIGPHISKSKSIGEHNEIIQIEVLDQRQTPFGEEACGYHAWKNALIGLALATTKAAEDQIFLASLFDNEDFYNDAIVEFFYPNRLFPDGDKDLSIPVAQRAYQRLMKEEIGNEALQRVVSILKESPHSISFLNPTEEMLFGGLDESSLSNIFRFYQAVNRPGPATHAIVVGNFPHWTTLLLEIDDKGKQTWYGCDSYANQPKNLLENLNILNNHIRDKASLDAQVLLGYNEAVGFDLSRKAKRLKEGNQDSLLQSQAPQGANPESFDPMLLNINSVPRRIRAAIEFLKEMNLTQDPHYKQTIADISALSDFYTKRAGLSFESL